MCSATVVCMPVHFLHEHENVLFHEQAFCALVRPKTHEEHCVKIQFEADMAKNTFISLKH